MPLPRSIRLLPFLTGLVFAAVAAGHTAPTTFTAHFESGRDGWSAGFADYPKGQETFYELEAGLREGRPT